MITAEQKKIVEFYNSKYKETGNVVYKKAAEYWSKKFKTIVKLKKESKKKEEKEEEKEGG